MPIKSYGVLKCQPLQGMHAADTSHYEVHAIDNNFDYRIAINVRSQQSPPELLYYIDENFTHDILSQLENLPLEYTALESKPGSIALDYLRSNLFDYRKMKIAHPIIGPDNELAELIEKYIDLAIRTSDASVYAFGQKWGPETALRDQYFGFKPGNGMHDIHMNQGNTGQFTKDNGPYQDGGLLIHFPTNNQWIAIFLAFQSQSFDSANSN
ncbi:putative protein YukJ [Sporomusaceae bacterium BoRhaA]|uniref:YukJ family protein n=1 Tax=Pelorhabdus rhamnosifermentans TaxID=2772457 RepID=UPI001C061D4A|nr:YukJ family protein [Pelorhabdus rhamnosifermentans]MBU2699344.1 putative protein YukJ [Pelorhabdus rhamnosifermentans]